MRGVLVGLAAFAVAVTGCGRIGFDDRTIGDATGGAWYAASQYRKSLTIGAGHVRGDLASFPVAVIAAGDADLVAHARADGGDLVFTASDGVTRLPYEIDSFAAGGALCAWVKLPAVAAAADTTFYLYYGDPNAMSEADAATTWSEYRAVWHMSETPTVDTVARDSTANHNDGAFQGMMMATDQVGGLVHGALDLDGVDDFLAVPSTSSLGFGNGATDTALTIDAWVLMRNASAFKVVAKGPAPPPLEYYFRTGDQTDDLLLMRVYDATGNYLGRRYSVGLTPLTDRWTHLAATYDGSGAAAGIALYVNGERVDDQDASSGTYVAMSPTASVLDLGRYQSGGNFTKGKLDEIRIGAGARSPAWIHASYANVSDPTFVAIGAEERR